MEMMKTSNVTCRLSLINNNVKNSRCYSHNFKFTCCASQMRYSVETVFISIYMTNVLAQTMRGYFQNGCKKLPKWYHAVSGSVHHKVPETINKLRMYPTSRLSSILHSWQSDYYALVPCIATGRVLGPSPAQPASREPGFYKILPGPGHTYCRPEKNIKHIGRAA